MPVRASAVCKDEKDGTVMLGKAKNLAGLATHTTA